MYVDCRRSSKEKDRRLSRERSMERERRRSRSTNRRLEFDGGDQRTGQFDSGDPRAVKRTGSGRMIGDQIPSYSRPEAKPRSLSFRVSPIQQHQQQVTSKSARYSETHFSAGDAGEGGLPPPLPSRRGKQRASEPVLFPSMPEAILGLEAQRLTEIDSQVSASSVSFIISVYS